MKFINILTIFNKNMKMIYYKVLNKLPNNRIINFINNFLIISFLIM